MRPQTMSGLIAWLMNDADRDDAFGATDSGFNKRLAASVIAEMESTMARKLADIQLEVNRLEAEMISRG